MRVNIVTPVQSADILVRHATREALVCTVQYNIKKDLWSQSSKLREVATGDPSDAVLPMKISMMENEIFKGDYDLSNDIPIDTSESEKTAYGN